MNAGLLGQINLAPAFFLPQFADSFSENGADITCHTAIFGLVFPLNLVHTLSIAKKALFMINGAARRALGLAAIFSTLLVVSPAQDTTSGGPDSIIAGPFGVPRMVVNEGGDWEEPLKVFEDANVEVFTPDITSPAWIQWHSAEFREKGTYFTYIYLYGRKSRSTRRETVYVDTRKNTAIVLQPLLPPVNVDISTAPVAFAKSIARISAIVQDQSDRFQGLTIQEALREQRAAVAHMAACANNFGKCNNPTPNPAASSNDDSVTPPRLLSHPNAVLPPAARAAGARGMVFGALTVDATGHTKDIRITKPAGYGLDESAVVAWRQYQFAPAIDTKTGMAVEYHLDVEITFK